MKFTDSRICTIANQQCSIDKSAMLNSQMSNAPSPDPSPDPSPSPTPMVNRREDHHEKHHRDDLTQENWEGEKKFEGKNLRSKSYRSQAC
jgi:hypothetical protein